MNLVHRRRSAAALRLSRTLAARFAVLRGGVLRPAFERSAPGGRCGAKRTGAKGAGAHHPNPNTCALLLGSTIPHFDSVVTFQISGFKRK